MSERRARAAGAVETVALVALGLWTGALLTTGAAAAITFPTLRDLAPTLPGFPGAPPEQHWALAAGQIMNRVFGLTDVIGLVALSVTAGAMLGLRALRWPRPRGVVRFARLALLGLGIGVAGYTMLVLRPTMDADLRAYWAAAEAGEADLAAAARASFEALHPHASRVLSVQFFGALGLFAAVALAARRPGPAPAGERGP